MLNGRVAFALAFSFAAFILQPGWAASAIDPSGTWAGTIFIKPGESEIDIRVELTRTKDGRWSGVMSVPGQSVSRKPLEDVTFVPPKTVSWIYRDNAGVSILTGTVSPDGRKLVGEHQEQGEKYSFTLRRVEPGSEPPRPGLVNLSGTEELRALFNRDAGKTRLVLILSPSCGLCFEGARMVERYVLDAKAGDDLTAFVIWTPISKNDHRERAVEATSHLADPRARHFWDRSLAVQRSFSAPLGLKDSPAWDVYLVYGPGKRWDKAPPVPDVYMHRRGDDMPRDRILNGPRLIEEVEKIRATKSRRSL